MSANNQTLIKEHNGKWYIFTDIMAERWMKKTILYAKDANAICNSRDEAYKKALELDSGCGQFGEGTEYGVQFNRLCKDDTEIIIKQ